MTIVTTRRSGRSSPERPHSSKDNPVMKGLIRLSIWALALGALSLAQAEEPDDTFIIKRILRTREQILKASSDGTKRAAAPVFLAFWDFDGTILKGDCSEGLNAGEKPGYRGLAQVAIEHGLSRLYPHDGGFVRFWTDYTNLDTRVGHWLAYPFIPQMLRGAEPEEVLQLSQAYFAGTLSNYLMASSVKIIRALEQGGVESVVLSASADLFVKGAARSLGLPAERLNGIRVRTREGRLTEELIYPVTWNVGKLERLRQITTDLAREAGGRQVFVLAGFGDSYSTDGPFLKFIVTQSLVAGEPIAVFYGESLAPSEYQGLFFQTRHAATVSDEPRR
jgi:phosphoserine phosphatase